MDINRAYRAWRRRRLFLLGPGFLTALAAALWLAVEAPGSAWARLPCLSIAVVLAALLGHVLLQTVICDRLQHGRRLEEARGLRRQLQPWRGLAAASLLIIAALTVIPGLFHDSGREKPALAGMPRLLARRVETAPTARAPEPPPRAAEPDVPVADPPEPERPVAVEPPPAPETPDPKPALALEPSALELSDRDLLPLLAWPDPPPRREPAEPLVRQDQESERRTPSYRADLEDLRGYSLSRERSSAPPERAQPEEWDLDEWSSPEIRLDAMVLFGRNSERVPAMSLGADFPISRDESVVASWIAADLPHDAEGFRHDLPDWHHTTLAYALRFSGYTRHAVVDLALSAGFSLDFLGAVRGAPVTDHDPKFAPYVGIDAAVWEQGAVGLLVHAGQSVPVTLGGSSISVTDVVGTVRLDLTGTFSLHAGYRALFMRLKENPDLLPPGSSTNTMADGFSGPLVGLDWRF